MPETIAPTKLPHIPPPPVEPPPVDPFDEGGGEPERPKLKKLRLALVLGGLSFIALISTVFGMMMAVASDVPSLENETRFAKAENSVLLAADGETELAKLTDNENRILLGESEIAPYLKNAVIAIEDHRFFEHRGVDYKGIARALWQDIRSRSAAQGGSTITQQFVKNALEAQGDRSVFQKLREAAAAYHLERKWSKQKILTQYLNSVYFGNGAYGVESAMRTYFGEQRGVLTDDGEPVGTDPVTGEEPEERHEAAIAAPHEAALLAGIIASPTAYDPARNPQAAWTRRNLVLDRMLELRMITSEQHGEAVKQTLPKRDEINPPQPDSDEPYFTSWVAQQAVEHFGPDRVFGGGMRIQTTLDHEMQAAAEQAVGAISGIGPSAALVTIENSTGEVKAMIGGDSFRSRQFNLATNGHRQPGSAIKTFTLLAALRTGDYGASTTFASQRKEIPFRAANGKRDVFEVENYEDRYSGITTLANATAQSDNSVYAELGMKIGPARIARLARDMGIRTKLSTNPAFTLGGLKRGVTPLEMAFAYSTLANDGERVCAEWASYECGPVAIKGVGKEKSERTTREVFSEDVAELATSMLEGVVTSGTGTQAQVGEFAAGKTGTTENYGDAWFCGFIEQYTTCVWVGYPDKLQPMETEYAGSPVAGGTWPAVIWRTFMSQVIQIRDRRQAERDAEDGDDTETAPVSPVPAPAPVPEQTPSPEAAPAPEETPQPAPQQPPPPPQDAPPRQPPSEPSTPPSEGGGVAPSGAAG